MSAPFRSEEERVQYNVETGPDILGSVPLISWVQAGVWSETVDNFQPGDAEEWIPCPVKHSNKTFVLRVRGESMLNPYSRPSFHDGDLIFVDPDRRAENGSLVVVRLDNGKEAVFKKLVIEGEKQYLRALNPTWPEPVILIDENATLCGVVIFGGQIL
jgi:SOS-response transcriptional repressor LexA